MMPQIDFTREATTPLSFLYFAVFKGCKLRENLLSCYFFLFPKKISNFVPKNGQMTINDMNYHSGINYNGHYHQLMGGPWAGPQCTAAPCLMRREKGNLFRVFPAADS